MCYQCWLKEGEYSIINKKTKEAARLISNIYKTDDGVCGGIAHIVVDDWNLGDNSIDFCLNDTDDVDISKRCKNACIKGLKYLRELTIEERYSAMAIADGII
jgi:hypothetical protein